MADAFIGLTISVTLRPPSNAVLHGKVVKVIEGQTLALEQVFFPASGTRLPAWNVPSHQIADLEVLETPKAHVSAEPAPAPAPVPAPAPEAVQQRPSRARPGRQVTQQSASFADPAILSYGKSPATAAPEDAHPDVEYVSTPSRGSVTAIAASLPAQAPSLVDLPSAATTITARKSSVRTVDAGKNEHAPHKAVKKRSQERMGSFGKVAPVETRQHSVDHHALDSQTGKKARRGTKGPSVKVVDEYVLPQQTISPDVSRNGNDMSSTTKSTKGWRSTPILQDPSQANNTGEESATYSASGKRRPRRKPGKKFEMQNGWATEDASDIHDMGEFDFAANLSKFDKKSVFAQIHNEDTTADEDRLVHHNRLARPGTYGGKNLHHSENVLSPPPPTGPRHAPPGNDFESQSETHADAIEIGSGRPSRSSSKRAQGRLVSGVLDDGLPSNALARSLSSLRGTALRGAAASVANSSPNPNRGRSPHSSHSPMESMEQLHLGGGSLDTSEAHFRSKSTHVPCPVLTLDALRAIEYKKMFGLGISPEAIAEISARGVAETILPYALPGGNIRRGSKATTVKPSTAAHGGTGSKPVIVMLAGNHAVSACVLATARHLYGRGFKVLISVSNYETPKLWSPHLAKQIQTLQALGRKAARIEGWRSTYAHIKKLNGPPAVIVDGALWGGIRYADIQGAEQQTEMREMIEWANRSRASVISIGCPSGYDSTSGDATVVEGEPIAVKPDRVLALGAPVQGLLEAAKNGEGAAWEITLLDVGANLALSGEELIPFGSEWSMDLEYVPPAASSQGVGIV